MEIFVSIIHVFCCLLVILLVLIQSGKGAEISSSFAGSSQTVFGSSGGANFFTRLTASIAGIFMLTSLTLTLMGGVSKKSLFERVENVSEAQSNPSGTNPDQVQPPAPAVGDQSKPTE